MPDVSIRGRREPAGKDGGHSGNGRRAGFRAAPGWVTLREAREEFRMATAAPTEDMQRAAACFASALDAARSRLRDVHSEMAMTQA